MGSGWPPVREFNPLRPKMSFEDWIFALHLLTAATLVGGLVMSWIILVALRSADTPDATLSLNRFAMVATGAVAVGLPGTIGLGIWLAILRPVVPDQKRVIRGETLQEREGIPASPDVDLDRCYLNSCRRRLPFPIKAD